MTYLFVCKILGLERAGQRRREREGSLKVHLVLTVAVHPQEAKADIDAAVAALAADGKAGSVSPLVCDLASLDRYINTCMCAHIYACAGTVWSFRRCVSRDKKTPNLGSGPPQRARAGTKVPQKARLPHSYGVL